MPSKQHKKPSKQSKLPLYLLYAIISICIIIVLLFLINQFSNSSQKEKNKVLEKKQEKQLEMLNLEQEQQRLEEKSFNDKLKSMKVDDNLDTNIEEIPKISKKDSITFYYDDDKVINKTIVKKKTTILTKPVIKEELIKKTEITKKLPMLAIIIDDVISKRQIKKVQSIPYPVTMAFLPPTLRHKSSAKITNELDTYMIHIPLEARIRQYEEENTLHVGDSYKTMYNRVKELKRLYPKAKYINNHTGSKFTKDADSMNKLLKVLKEFNLIFVDSRTTSNTATKEYANKYKLRYLSRNIFLDNKKDKRYIQKQLKKVVRIAKKDGFAIAIGHPHSITIDTLAKSQYLLEGIELVLINKL